MSGLSRSSLELFAGLLSQVQISAQAPDLVEQAQRVQTAREEITAALDHEPSEGPPTADK